MQFKALLLDLDGTLVDTAPDMVAALNHVLAEQNRPLVDEKKASKFVSNGAKGLLEFGFDRELSETEAKPLLNSFLVHYTAHIADNSKPYPGMTDILNYCDQHNIRWGVVTNKPLALSRALLEGLDLLNKCSILLGGDSLPVKKPDPAPLLHCCMVLNLAASECLYIGDHARDIIAGKSAGMDTATALWGYINDGDDPQSWNANYLIGQPSGLMTLIKEKISQH